MNRIFKAASDRQIDVGLLFVRLALGAIFIAHGGQKLFVYGFAGVSGAFGQMGVPLAGIAGPAVALVEFFGGIAILLGLLTRPAALGLAVTMLGALFLVHLPAGFFLPEGSEFVLLLLAAAAQLTLTGAGRYSVDASIAERTVGAEARPALQPEARTRRAA